MTKNVPITEEGIETVLDCLLIAKSCYEDRIGRTILGDAYFEEDLKKKVKRYRQKVETIDNLIRHLEKRLSKKEKR